MTEIKGILSTIAPGTEILLALKALRAGERVPIQLAQIRRGRCRRRTAQLTLRPRLQAAAPTALRGLCLQVLRPLVLMIGGTFGGVVRVVGTQACLDSFLWEKHYVRSL
jgi:hypothetical protein